MSRQTSPPYLPLRSSTRKGGGMWAVLLRRLCQGYKVQLILAVVIVVCGVCYLGNIISRQWYLWECIRSPPLRDLYPTSDRVYGLHPFHEMFFPLIAGDDSFELRRSVVAFTAGRSGLRNVDSLVRAWGHDHFDYIVCHYDESMGEWQNLDWYKNAVGFYAHRQGKMWFFKRILNPYLVKNYAYVHFVDSDAGSPPGRPFSLWEYEKVLREHRVMVGQPAVSERANKTIVWDVTKEHPGNTLRWTTFVENGPLFSVRVRDGAYDSLWEMVNANAVSGYGVDLSWCPYLYQVKGFKADRTCAVVDAHTIDHLDTHSGTNQTYDGAHSYAELGGKEWDQYGETLRPIMSDYGRVETLATVKG